MSAQICANPTNGPLVPNSPQPDGQAFPARTGCRLSSSPHLARARLIGFKNRRVMSPPASIDLSRTRPRLGDIRADADPRLMHRHITPGTALSRATRCSTTPDRTTNSRAAPSTCSSPRAHGPLIGTITDSIIWEVLRRFSRIHSRRLVPSTVSFGAGLRTTLSFLSSSAIPILGAHARRTKAV